MVTPGHATSTSPRVALGPIVAVLAGITLTIAVATEGALAGTQPVAAVGTFLSLADEQKKRVRHATNAQRQYQAQDYFATATKGMFGSEK